MRLNLVGSTIDDARLATVRPFILSRLGPSTLLINIAKTPSAGGRLPSQSVIGEINLLTIAIPGRSCWTNKFKTVMLQWNSVSESFPGR